MSRRRPLEIILESEYVSIGELARITNIRYSTLKYYTEEQMIPFQQKDERLVRRYKREEVIPILDRINELKKMGLRIQEIKQQIKG